MSAHPTRRKAALVPAAATRRRGFPGLAAPSLPVAPHLTPVPTTAHDNPRAIRVRRSPR